MSAGGRIAAGVGANLIGQHSHDRNQEATVYCGNMDTEVGINGTTSMCFALRVHNAGAVTPRMELEARFDAKLGVAWRQHQLHP